MAGTVRRLLRPILLEFFRTHFILTAAGALLTVVAMAVSALLGFGESFQVFFSQRGAGAASLGALLPVLPILGLCLLAYLPAGRFARRGSGLPRPDVGEALLLLLLPAAAFWLLLIVGGLLNTAGAQLAALLLNCPAYGLVALASILLGWQTAAPLWTAYAGGLVAGLLPPLLFLAGACLPIPELDPGDAEEDFIEKQ